MNEHEQGQVAASAAEIYDTFFVPALFAEWPAHVLRAAHVHAGDMVLDVACGTGVLARAAAEVVVVDGAVTGVDINEGMLALAQQKAPQIRWRHGAAEALSFADEKFDCVVSQFGLMFFQDPVAALVEMRRVLRPNGRLAIAVWDRLARTPGYAAVAQILSDLFGPGAAQSIEAPYAMGDTQQLSALFVEAGMPNATIETVVGQARFDSVEAWIYTDIKGWTLADVIDDAGYERLRTYAAPRLAQFVQPNGSVAFAAPAHIVTVVNR
ncbi:MAG: methyltransferase domain-containing protein [Anaerolineales bacterium]|nr:methyltransferase domain-containing protein [Anaerolineales bacterium]MCA9952313.1 methyltransferase domain-containing protein [Anaerolineales bacterium]